MDVARGAIGEHLPAFFELREPERERPVLFEVPHAGMAIPDAVQDELQARRDQVARGSDIYVDKLCDGVTDDGAYLLVAHTSRFVVDLNRAEDDVDGRTVPDHPSPQGTQPRGVVWRMTTEGHPLMKGPLDYARLERRLALFHRPYHQTLRATLDSLRARHGHVILIAAHSMPSAPRLRGPRRADVVPGTRSRTTASAALIDAVAAHFRDAGLRVKHDDPYRGGYTTAHYGRPDEGVHAVQIELNRDLYVHEGSGQPKAGAFESIQDVMTRLARRLADFQP